MVLKAVIVWEKWAIIRLNHLKWQLKTDHASLEENLSRQMQVEMVARVKNNKLTPPNETKKQKNLDTTSKVSFRIHLVEN